MEFINITRSGVSLVTDLDEWNSETSDESTFNSIFNDKSVTDDNYGLSMWPKVPQSLWPQNSETFYLVLQRLVFKLTREKLHHLL